MPLSLSFRLSAQQLTTREQGHWHRAFLGLRRQQPNDGLDDGALFLEGVRVRAAADMYLQDMSPYNEFWA
jgi:hypothetical protein